MYNCTNFISYKINMATRNPEALNSPENPETRQELKELRLDISKDHKKFESLSKDPVLKKWLEKLFKKNCEMTFSEEWKHFERLNIWKTMENILKKYPDLWFHISWELKLPLSERKFSNLSLQQKLNFTALHSAIFWKNIFYKKNPSSQDIIDRIRQNNKANFNKINSQFERENIKNLLDLEDTLKDFGLTSSEIWKVKEYLLLIKKHPEFAWINKPQEADLLPNWVWYAFFLLVGVALWVLWKYYIDNLWEVNTESTIEITRPGIVKVENPESVLKFMVTKGKFGNDPEHPIRWRDEVKMFTINDNDSWWKKWAKEKLNVIQSREIIMDLSWDVLGWFDLDEWCQINIETNYPSEWKWIAYVQLPEPDIMILNDEAKVVSEELERVHISEFKDTHEKLRQKLRSDAQAWISNDKEFYNKTKEDAKNNLLALFKTLKPYWMEIEDVRIRFFDPKKWEKPEPTVPDFRPEQRTIRFH